MKRRQLGLIFAMMLGLSMPALAQQDKTLTIGVAQETSSIFPNWFVSTPNQQIASHIFEPLVSMDENNMPQPALAVSWKTVDDSVWEFKLREGVVFHDGTPFTADNVIASFDHTKTVEGPGSSAGFYLRDKTYEKVDDHTIRISAKKPYPLMPREMSVVYIYKGPAEVESFNQGQNVIGTGPYKFVEWVRADRITLERYDGYWGDKPEWQKVVFKPITAGPARVAALLNGDVDLIDRVPTTDVKRLSSDANIHVESRPGERVLMLMVDSGRDLSPFVSDNSGQPLWPNPLREWKVRKALSMAINRPGIVDRVMDNQAVAAGQIATLGMFGYNPDIAVETFDAEAAKKLLAEAGYPEGFQLTLHGTNDRYINDSRILETVAQMWTRIGVKTKVETMPANIYFTRFTKGGEQGLPEFSMSMLGFGTATGETMSQLWTLLHTTITSEGLGYSNVGRYSNARIDAYLDEAIKTLDDAKRETMLKDISAQYMRDVALIPLHWQVNVWAMRKDLTMPPRLMEVTHAATVKSAN